MSIGQTFPDVIDLGGDIYRIITEGGFDWVHHNTTIGRDIPRTLLIFGDDIVKEMKEDGLRVRRMCLTRWKYPKWQGQNDV